MHSRGNAGEQRSAKITRARGLRPPLTVGRGPRATSFPLHSCARTSAQLRRSRGQSQGVPEMWRGFIGRPSGPGEESGFLERHTINGVRRYKSIKAWGNKCFLGHKKRKIKFGRSLLDSHLVSICSLGSTNFL